MMNKGIKINNKIKRNKHKDKIQIKNKNQYKPISNLNHKISLNSHKHKQISS